jgi:hypothetical protein
VVEKDPWRVIGIPVMAVAAAGDTAMSPVIIHVGTAVIAAVAKIT